MRPAREPHLQWGTRATVFSPETTKMCREGLKGRGWDPTSQSPQATATLPPCRRRCRGGVRSARPRPVHCTRRPLPAAGLCGGTQTPNEEIKHITAYAEVDETISENTANPLTSYNGKLIIISDLSKKTFTLWKKISIPAVWYGISIRWKQRHRRKKNSLMQMLVGHPRDAHLSDQCFKDTKNTDSGPKKLQLAHYYKFLKEKSWLTHLRFPYFQILPELGYLTLTNVNLLKVSPNPEGHLTLSSTVKGEF